MLTSKCTWLRSFSQYVRNVFRGLRTAIEEIPTRDNVRTCIVDENGDQKIARADSKVANSDQSRRVRTSREWRRAQPVRFRKQSVHETGVPLRTNVPSTGQRNPNPWRA